jgi:glycerol 3-phosphatase-2
MVALVDAYAGVVLDVDGVLVRGDVALPGAPETLAALRTRGVAIALVTNNASRTPARIAADLADAGIVAAPEEVITSPLAAAGMLPPGTRCLVIGMDGLRLALADRGCVEVHEPGDADAVVVGWNRHLVWDDLRRATLALTRGARFLGTNGDVSYPAAEGLWPGNGAILAALAAASARTPEIAGKPQAPLFLAAAERLPAGRLLMVGDRLDTDIAGAAALGWDTALVLTGVTARAAAAAADPAPTWVLDDVSGLLQRLDAAVRDADAPAP